MREVHWLDLRYSNCPVRIEGSPEERAFHLVLDLWYRGFFPKELTDKVCPGDSIPAAIQAAYPGWLDQLLETIKEKDRAADPVAPK